jgi:hypothetical protein
MIKTHNCCIGSTFGQWVTIALSESSQYNAM